ncbi:hypothetical protein HB364_18650 [Pseudoflavitalea sp. X16]|uniref:hypothetical protein n=1 Tax=Paraflavitalea devenefica TaxID=2716334 RepID=UPI00141DFBF0|nr:hypothetical protein [Paraflavitalea devenefica]NII27115.1 hypothetical protein [Paraflavitalea devenefica]
MVKTGISIPEVFSIMAILLPVIPILIIFIRRTWQQDIMIFLGAICLLSFLQHLMIYIPRLIPANNNSINSVFGLGEFAVLLYLFKMIITTGWLREIMNTVLIAFLSVAITAYALRGTETHSFALAIAAAFILLVAAVIALLQLIRDKQLFIFQSPVFWIAGGNICYFSMFILTGFVGAQGKGTLALQQEKMILLSVINGIRFIFFIVAANMARKEKEQANN